MQTIRRPVDRVGSNSPIKDYQCVRMGIQCADATVTVDAAAAAAAANNQCTE